MDSFNAHTLIHFNWKRVEKSKTPDEAMLPVLGGQKSLTTEGNIQERVFTLLGQLLRALLGVVLPG